MLRDRVPASCKCVTYPSKALPFILRKVGMVGDVVFVTSQVTDMRFVIPSSPALLKGGIGFHL